MKLRFTIWALMVAAVLAFGACDKDDDIRVSSTFNQALLQRYPNVYDVEWERKGAYFVADCKQSGGDLHVWFNAKGEWLMTETEVYSLPEAVMAAFRAGEYGTWMVEDMDKLEYAGGTLQYVVEVETGRQELQLFYAEDGTLLQTKNVTNQDDTHWPVTGR